MTCAQLQKHERFAAAREAWNKEYRRINARKARGSVSQREWDAWWAEMQAARERLDDNTFWIPFDLWKRSLEQSELRRQLEAAENQPMVDQLRALFEATKLESETQGEDK